MTLIMVTFNNYHSAQTDVKLHYDSRKANEDGDSMHIMNGWTYNKSGGSELISSSFSNKKSLRNRRRKERPIIESCDNNVNIKNNYSSINNKINTHKNKNNKRKQGGSKGISSAFAMYGHKNVQ